MKNYIRGTVPSRNWKPTRRLADFDYLWSYGLSEESRRALAPECTTLESEDGFLLCRIEKQGRQIR
jgi:hypothetical protein